MTVDVGCQERIGGASRGTGIEVQHVRPVVMPDRVEPLALGEQARRVKLRVEDAFLVVQRPRQVRPVGSKDRAAAAPQQANALQLSGEREVIGVRKRALEVAGAITYARLSRARCTSVACHSSSSAAVAAT